MQPTYTIEKEVPIPPPDPTSGEIPRALRALEPGDSFLVPKEKRTHVASTAHRLDIEVVTRKVSDTEVRVWRTK